MADQFIPVARRIAGFLFILMLVAGCATRPRGRHAPTRRTDFPARAAAAGNSPRRKSRRAFPRRKGRSWRRRSRSSRLRQQPHHKGYKVRVITEAEISKLQAKDPYLTPTNVMDILARLNIRAKYYVAEDVKNKRPLKVPNDFSAYKDWTAMPLNVPALTTVPKLIVVVKDIPFIGWYEKGKLVGDAQICIGKQAPWTKAGLYEVLDKDAKHISQSYPERLRRAGPHALGATGLRPRVDTHGRHRSGKLFARVHQPAPGQFHRTVRMGRSQDPRADRRVPAGHGRNPEEKTVPTPSFSKAPASRRDSGEGHLAPQSCVRTPAADSLKVDARACRCR